MAATDNDAMGKWFDGLRTMWGIPGGVKNLSVSVTAPVVTAPKPTSPAVTLTTPPVQATTALTATPQVEQQAAQQVATTVPAPGSETASSTASKQTPPVMMTQERQQTTPGVALSPELQTQTEEILNQKAAAQREDLRLQSEAAREQANIIEARNAEYEQQRQRDEAEALRIKAEADKAQDTWLKAQEDYKKNAKIDPDRHWKQKGEGSRVLAALAQGLGAFGSALTKTPNYASQIVKEAVEADVRAQERDIDTKRGAVGDAANMIHYFRQKGLDQKSAALAAKMTIYERAQAKLEAMLAKTSNQRLLQQGEIITAGIEAEKQALRNQNYLNSQSRIVKESMTAPVGGASVSDQIRLNELIVDVPTADPKTAKKDPLAPTTGYAQFRARNAEDAKKARDAFVKAEEARASLRQLREFLEANPLKAHVPGTEANKQVAAVAGDLLTSFAQMHNLGAISGPDYELAKSQLGSPTGLQWNSTTRNLINRWGDRLNNMVFAQLKGRGILQ
jgi:hypothetical protein